MTKTNTNTQNINKILTVAMKKNFSPDVLLASPVRPCMSDKAKKSYNDAHDALSAESAEGVYYLLGKYGHFVDDSRLYIDSKTGAIYANYEQKVLKKYSKNKTGSTLIFLRLINIPDDGGEASIYILPEELPANALKYKIEKS